MTKHLPTFQTTLPPLRRRNNVVRIEWTLRFVSEDATIRQALSRPHNARCTSRRDLLSLQPIVNPRTNRYRVLNQTVTESTTTFHFSAQGHTLLRDASLLPASSLPFRFPDFKGFGTYY